MSAAGVIDRPVIVCDEDHRYTLDGEPVPGISTVAKRGEDAWGPGSWWGWGIACEGIAAMSPRDFDGLRDREDVEALLKGEGWTPNRKRDDAADRGTSVHDALEALVQDGKVPNPKDYPESERGHVLSLLRWFTHYRPEFEAAEVVVGSRIHRFAGRYDLRCKIRRDRLGIGPWVESEHPVLGKSKRRTPDFLLCLVDLKTSKGVYPKTHFPQLAGYELASVEMGFAPTDAQFILRTSPDGSFVPWEAVEPKDWPQANFVRSWGTEDDFLGYLAAHVRFEGLEDRDPKVIHLREEAARRRRQEDVVVGLLEAVGELGATARELTDELESEHWDSKTTSRVLQRLKGQKRVACKGRTWRAVQ